MTHQHRSIRGRAALCGVLALTALAWAQPAAAADEGLVLRMSAERLASEDRCEEAIGKARRARELRPGDAAAAVIEGRCLLVLRRYDEAIPALEEARRLDPSLRGVAADLASAHYHLDDYAEAEREVDRAEAEGGDDPRVALYRGLLLLAENRSSDAAEQFERASRMDPAMDPLASYYAGIAWERAADKQKARAALERLAQRGPDDPWAREAQTALDRIEGAPLDRSAAAYQFGPGRWWARLTGGLEWDDNVVLRGDGTVLPGNISAQDDWRGFWSAEGGIEMFRSQNWASGVIGGYHGNAHFRNQRFDLQYPTASIWLDRRVDDTSFLRLQPFVGYAWTQTDPYLFNAGATLSHHKGWADAGTGRLYAQYTYRNYLFNVQEDPNFPRYERIRDRDGDEYRVGYDHSYGLTETTALRAGVYYAYFDTEGGEFSHDAYAGSVGVNQQLPLEFTLDVEGAFHRLNYDRSSTFLVPNGTLPNLQPQNSPHRRDNRYDARVTLSRPITPSITASGHYRFTENDSNTPVFDYDRNVVGGSITVRFGSR